MNLNAVVSQAIGTVNPRQIVVLQVSTGSTTNADGSRTPSYASPVSLIAQWQQEFSLSDISMMESLNIQGTRSKVWLNGEVDGLVREHNKGGDLITTPNADVWLVAFVSEQWTTSTGTPNWVSVVVTRQNNS